MTDDDRKLLTEYLGECWHKRDIDLPTALRCVCGMRFSYEDQLIGHIENDNEYRTRTFSTPADLHAVYSKMVEKVEWPEFMTFAGREHDKGLDIINSKTWGFFFTAWLFRLNAPDQIPERMKMVAGWIKSKGAA